MNDGRVSKQQDEQNPSLGPAEKAGEQGALIDTGDSVLHAPSGETWLVAYVRGGYVCACGWPASLAPVTDCTLVKKASPEARLELLHDMRNTSGSRGTYARAALASEAPAETPAASEAPGEPWLLNLMRDPPLLPDLTDESIERACAVLLDSINAAMGDMRDPDVVLGEGLSGAILLLRNLQTVRRKRAAGAEAGSAPLADDDRLLRFLCDLHSHLPEADRPMGWSDFSDEQATRARKAFAKLVAGSAPLVPEPPTIADFCPDCDHGLRGGKPCQSCGGTGLSPKQEWTDADLRRAHDLGAALAAREESLPGSDESEPTERAVCQPAGLMFDALGEPRVRYVRITFEGSHLIQTPKEAEAFLADVADPSSYVLSDVYLSEREADDLPEFDGF